MLVKKENNTFTAKVEVWIATENCAHKREFFKAEFKRVGSKELNKRLGTDDIEDSETLLNDEGKKDLLEDVFVSWSEINEEDDTALEVNPENKDWLINTGPLSVEIRAALTRTYFQTLSKGSGSKNS